VDTWREESLWGIRTTNQLTSSLDVFRGRRIPTLGAMSSKAWGRVDESMVRSVVRTDERNFARMDARVQKQRQRVLGARARLATLKKSNEAIEEERQRLMAERRARTQRARDTYQTAWHAANRSAQGGGRT
jgi:hypothetical protein